MNSSESCTPISSGRSSLEQVGLILQPRAGRIAERVALAAVVGLEAVEHRHVGRVGEAPQRADLGVQQLGVGLGGLQRERLHARGS